MGLLKFYPSPPPMSSGFVNKHDRSTYIVLYGDGPEYLLRSCLFFIKIVPCAQLQTLESFCCTKDRQDIYCIDENDWSDIFKQCYFCMKKTKLQSSA